MKISIEEMKLVDSLKTQLEKLALQVAAKEAAMKQEVVDEACKQFKLYFANRKFELSGSAWNLVATYGSIVFKLVIKNASTGGLECLILHYPELVKLPPVAIFMELKRDEAADKIAAAAAPKGPLAEVQAQIDLMLGRLNAPPKEWIFYTVGEQPEEARQQTSAQGNLASQRKEYVTFARFLTEECP